MRWCGEFGTLNRGTLQRIKWMKEHRRRNSCFSFAHANFYKQVIPSPPPLGCCLEAVLIFRLEEDSVRNFELAPFSRWFPQEGCCDTHGVVVSAARGTLWSSQ